MNGEPVPADHGKPVRLVVPGWYGCTWIKWVNEIRLVGPDEPATTQMVEFANRTHQTAPHKFARDYTPADIQTAATAGPRREAQGPQRPRIPHRRHRLGRHQAGRSAADPLQATTRRSTPFAICPAPKTHAMWSLWEYRWKPAAPGIYDIALDSADPIGAAAAARRRATTCAQVKIDEVVGFQGSTPGFQWRRALRSG